MKVITLSRDLFHNAIDQLSAKCIPFNPDIIIGILNGGSYVGKRFIKNDLFKNKEYHEIKLQRITTKKKQSKLFSIIVKSLPYFITNFLRVYESHKLSKKITIQDDANLEIIIPDLPIDKNKLLIVDDAIDSGFTMNRVCLKMKEKYPHLIIKTACVVCTTKNPVIFPDYKLYDQVLIRFPWSSDYRGNDKFI